MASSRIGLKQPDLYLSWAHFEHSFGNHSRAKSILNAGIKSNIQPKEQLENALKQLDTYNKENITDTDATQPTRRIRKPLEQLHSKPSIDRTLESIKPRRRLLGPPSRLIIKKELTPHSTQPLSPESLSASPANKALDVSLESSEQDSPGQISYYNDTNLSSTTTDMSDMNLSQTRNKSTTLRAGSLRDQSKNTPRVNTHTPKPVLQAQKKWPSAAEAQLTKKDKKHFIVYSFNKGQWYSISTRRSDRSWWKL
jgi:hypothetical protein